MQPALVKDIEPAVTEDTRSSTRTVIVSGSFRIDYSYQENIWAEYLAAMGDEVTVVTAGRHDHEQESVQGYRVVWLKTRGLFSRHLYFERRVARMVESLRPDRILWFGPPQLFGASLCGHTPLNAVPLAIFMGQNRQMHAFDWTENGLSIRERLTALAYQLIRIPTITRACHRANLVVATTQETPRILEALIPIADWAQIRPSVWCCPLGFDEHTFRFEPHRRRTVRRELGIAPGAPVILVTSRFVSEKWPVIQFTVDALREVLTVNDDVQLMIVGLDDNELSQQMRAMCTALPESHRIHCVAFAPRDRLAALFCAADCAVFARPSISCQEALGTGLLGVFADDGTMNWLLSCHEDGRLFTAGDRSDLVTVVDRLLQSIRMEGAEFSLRNERVKRARRLGYSNLIETSLTRLNQSDVGAPSETSSC